MSKMTKDRAAKDLLGNNINFASVFNYYLFKGRKVIRPGLLHDINIEQRYFDETAGVERRRDLLKLLSCKENDDAAYLCLGIESQSSIDGDMILRIILYDAITYLNQRKMQIGRRRPLKPVITIIFNCSGKPWKKSRSLYDLLDIPEEIREIFEEYCGNHALFIFDPYSMSDEELDKFSDEIRMVTKAMKYHNNKDKYYEHMTRSEMKDVSDVVYYAITVLNNDTETILIRNDRGRVDMCRATREIAEEKKAIWQSEVRSEGIKEGKIEALVSSVRAVMDNLNLSAEAVFEIMNVPTEYRSQVLALI